MTEALRIALITPARRQRHALRAYCAATMPCESVASEFMVLPREDTSWP